MTMSGGRYSRGASQVAICGILAALSVVFLYMASFIPTGPLGIVAIAGLFPMAAVISAGVKAGFFCWAAAGVLALLIIPGKGGAILFLIFLGLYPVLKSLIERIGKLIVEWLCKLACFNLALAAGVWLLGTMLMDALPQQLQQLWILWPVANVAFVIYDIGLSKLAMVYMVRVDKRLRK